MREVMLSAHFIGLAMTLGTSLAFMFLGISGSKLEKKEAQKFVGYTLGLNRMIDIGLTLMVLSGGYLMTPYWKVLGDMPLLIAKLTLVLLLIIEVIFIHVYTKKARKENMEPASGKIKALDRIALATTLVIVILAVSVFH